MNGVIKMKDNKLKDFFMKNKIAVIIGGIALVAIIVGVIIALVSCGGDSGKNNDKSGPVEYTLNVLTEGGMPFEDVNVYVYEEMDIDKLLYAGKTDENGQFKFTTDLDPVTFGYKLDGIPEDGYQHKDMYTLKSSEKEEGQLYLHVGIEMKPLEDMANTKFELGSIMKDFTVTTPDGTKVTISELYDKNDAVVLNFFYLACQPCKNEFPYLEEAYKQYGDEIAVIAMTPVDKDDAKIKAFAEELGLTFYVAQCPSEWEQMMDLQAYPTTVVIDKWKMISYIHEGSVTESGIFESIFAYYTSSDYVQCVNRYLDDIINAEAEEGTAGNPITILPDASEFDASVPAGKEVYFEIPKVTNMILTIKDADAYVTYNEEIYQAKDGVVSLVVSAPDSFTPAQIIIGNKGSQDKTFKGTLKAIKGTMMNPYTMSVGSVTTDIEAGNEQGVYYTYTATESGTLTLKPSTVGAGTAFDITLYNLNTYVNNTISANGNGDGSVSIVVNAGDVVQIVVGTLPNTENEYPAASIATDVTFVPGEGTGSNNNGGDIQYSVKVTDADGKAMSGVAVVIDTAEMTTDASGMAKVTLKSGSYTVMITPPTGYKVQGEVVVTADAPSVTVTLVSTTAKQVTYTVKVTDESGKAISGATVIVGSSLVTTNASGSATISLAEGSYDVTVSASGYATGSGKVTKNSTSTTIKLKKSTAAQTGTTYTVNVIDYKNVGQEGFTVIFKKNGSAITTSTTDSNGKATAKLEKGTYDIQVVSTGYGFDTTNAKVTSSKTSTTIMVAKVTTNVEDAYFDATGAYVLSTGGNYVEIPSADSKNEGGNAFFLFSPNRSGTYVVTVYNANATIDYWGGNGTTGTIQYGTLNIEHTKSSLTFNVIDAGPTYVIGIQGVENCIVSVVRTGKATTEMDWTDYEGTDTIKPFTLGSGTLTYVDITKPTSNYNLVYNSNDGYYHLGSVSGPVMLVHLGVGAPYIALSDVIGLSGSGGSNFGRYFYDSNNTLIKKENYTSLLAKYINNMDQSKYVYPLTKDLMYIIKNGGEYRGWWASSGYGNTIYAAEPDLNAEIAWMFACCYVAQ